MLATEDLIQQIQEARKQHAIFVEQNLEISTVVYHLDLLEHKLYAIAVKNHLIQALDIEIKTRPKSQLARAYQNFKREIKG